MGLPQGEGCVEAEALGVAVPSTALSLVLIVGDCEAPPNDGEEVPQVLPLALREKEAGALAAPVAMPPPLELPVPQALPLNDAARPLPVAPPLPDCVPPTAPVKVPTSRVPVAANDPEPADDCVPHEPVAVLEALLVPPPWLPLALRVAAPLCDPPSPPLLLPLQEVLALPETLPLPLPQPELLQLLIALTLLSGDAESDACPLLQAEPLPIILTETTAVPVA